MTTYADLDQLMFAPDTHAGEVTAAAPLTPDQVAALVDEMAGLSRGLFGLLAPAVGTGQVQSRAIEINGPAEATGLPVDQHPTGPVDPPAQPAAPVLQSVEMPATVPAVAAVPPASVRMPEPVAETVSVPLASVPMPGPVAAPPSIPMPVAPHSRSTSALAAALLDEISFLDD